MIRFLSTKLGNKHFYLLIDDADKLSAQDVHFLEQLSLETLHFVIASDKGFNEKHSMIFKKDSLNIQLKALAFQDLRNLIKTRIESVGGKGIFPFSENELEQLYTKSQKNTKKLLRLCYDHAVKKSLKVMQHRKAGKPVSQKLVQETTTQTASDIEGELRILAGMPVKAKEKKQEVKDYSMRIIDHPVASPIEIDLTSDNGEVIEIVKKEGPRKAPIKRREKTRSTRRRTTTRRGRTRKR